MHITKEERRTQRTARREEGETEQRSMHFTHGGGGDTGLKNTTAAHTHTHTQKRGDNNNNNTRTTKERRRFTKKVNES